MKIVSNKIIKTELIEWRNLKWFTTDLKKLSRESLERLKNSLKNNNFIQPFNVWDTGNITLILDGQYRMQAMISLERNGYDIPDLLPANFIECRDRKEAAKMVLLYSSIYARVTEDGLEALLNEYDFSLEEIRFDIDLADFNFNQFIKESTKGDTPDIDNQDDIPPLPQVSKTHSGDLYQLGPHRLLCGDATNIEHASHLMGSERAHLVFTDPPYGVSYKAMCGKFDIIKGDEKIQDDLVNTLLLPSFKIAAAITNPDAAFYIWHASSTREDFAFAMKAAGLIERQYLIWAKPGFIIGYSDYRWAHEPCFYAAKQGKTPAFYGDKSQSTVWHVALKKTEGASVTLGSGVLILDGSGGKIYIEPKAPKGRKVRTLRITPGQEIYITAHNRYDDLWEVGRDQIGDHPTQKPVELAVRAIENSSLPGDIVYDSFLGSGTTLIAAEMTNRICYGMEIDPRYCDTIINRYIKNTGNKTILKNGERVEWDI